MIEKDIVEAKSLAISATPTFVINGHTLVGRQSYNRLKQVVDAELNGENWSSPAPIAVDIGGAPFKGPESAPVTVVEFSDFQCAFCAKSTFPLQRLLAANPGKVRFVFKNFPLDIHPDSRLAHMAALAAGEQGKFWGMHDLIFSHQRTIKRSDLLSFANQLKLDPVRFQKDIDSPQLKALIEADKAEGERVGVVATPTFLVNGEVASGFSGEQLQTKIDSQTPHPIKIRWFVDLTSPLTARSAVAVQQFLASHTGSVQLEFKNFPL